LAEPITATDPTALSTEAIDRAVTGLKELLEAKLKCNADTRTEQFRAVEVQFSAIKERAKDLDDARATALSAALAAAKELVGAAQLTFDRQIVSLDGKVNDLKDRLTLMEGQRHGGQMTDENRHREILGFTSITAAVVSVGALLATLAFNLIHTTAVIH
jgi:hypothetical protein